jgi:predicted ATP-grasp superfamily ATP-dependent carboligase
MRVFVYEYVIGRGREAGTISLHVEGWAMLSALVEDFCRIPGVHVVTLVHSTLQRTLGHTCVRFSEGDEEPIFKRLAAEADFTLVIAPEFADLLLERCRWALEAGGRLLGSTPDAVALAADKLALAEHFQNHDIATPRTMRLGDFLAPAALARRPPWVPAVCKPRHGAGSQAVFLVHDSDDLEGAGIRATIDVPGDELIVQPFVRGGSASVAFLIGSQGILPLLPASQDLSEDGRFRYRGGELPLPPDLGERVIQLATRAVQAVSGLQGYVGVDLVLGESADASEDYVIEINPRLTTSYVGLRKLSCGNVAKAMLEVACGAPIRELAWHAGRVRFQPDGRVEFR